MSVSVIKPPTQYSGSLVYFLEQYVRQMLPSADSMFEMTEQLKHHCVNPDNTLILKKFGSFNKRGKMYENSLAHTQFTVADNEAPLWLYLRLAEKRPINFDQVISEQRLPLAFAPTKKEGDFTAWKTSGRSDLFFSNNGWKICQLLPPTIDVPKTREQYVMRFLRFLSPINQFPFPSPWKFEMEKDWGTDPKALQVVFSWLWHKYYPTDRYSDFTDFLKLVESDFPFQDPIDTNIAYHPRTPQVILPTADITKIFEHEISCEEKKYSIAREQLATSVLEFSQILARWYKHTDEETIGNVGGSGNIPWFFAETPIGKIQLSADSSRVGVKRYLDMAEKDGAKFELHSCPNKKGPLNIVAFGPYKKTIAKFTLLVC